MPLIALHGLTKRYPGGVTALDGLTLDLESGIIGLVGANGAGKSTLLKILLGTARPDRRHRRGDGHGRPRAGDDDPPVRRLHARVRLPPARHLGDRLRQPHGPDVRPARVPRPASGRPRSSATSGLYEERYRAIGGYSTGMKQRVKLAQALVHDPTLLLLDEPTNGLDPAGRDEMLSLVRRTGAEFGIAVIVASHLLGEIERVCDFLVAIDAGHLLRAAPLGSFTERTGYLAVEVEEGEMALADALATRGLVPAVDGRTVVVPITDDRPYDIVRDVLADLGLPLVRLEQRRRGLEDLFADAATDDGSTPAPSETR